MRATPNEAYLAAWDFATLISMSNEELTRAMRRHPPDQIAGAYEAAQAELVGAAPTGATAMVMSGITTTWGELYALAPPAEAAHLAAFQRRHGL